MQKFKAIKRRISAYAQLKNNLKYNAAEIREMDAAIFLIRNDPDYRIFEMRFFGKKKMDELAEIFYFDKTTIWRKLNKMLKKISAYLDGDQNEYI